MDSAKIMVVEDEPIVARDLQLSLERLGYAVPATASSGEEALRRARECDPDLVLMDIVLKGRMDGIETAQQLRRQLNIPVLYLTAYADQQTVQRATTTTPLGYLLKPFQPTDLHRAVQVALSRAGEDRQLRENLRWLLTMVCCVKDAIITTDRAGIVTYMNAAAEQLTGWSQESAIGAGLAMLLTEEAGATVDEAQNPALRAMIEGRVISMAGVFLVGRDARERRVEGTAAPVCNDGGLTLGAIVVFRECVEAGGGVLSDDDPTSFGEEFMGGTHLEGVINLCAWCKRVPDRSGGWYDLETYLTEHPRVAFNGGLCPECLDRCFPREQQRLADPGEPWREDADGHA